MAAKKGAALGEAPRDLSAVLEPAHPQLSLRRQCDLLGISRASWYYQPRGESAENLEIMRRLDEQYTRTPFYGIRRMTAWLQQQGYAVNHKRVARLLRQMGLAAVYPKPQLSVPGAPARRYPYLLRGLAIERVNQVWSTDITYVRLPRGFLYLVAVLDWHSRYVLAWELSNTLDTTFCLAALDQALEQATPTIFNTDDLQFRSGGPVHQPGLHQPLGTGRDPDQLGWARAGVGQRVCRATLALSQVRGGVPARLHDGERGGQRLDSLLPLDRLAGSE